MLGPPPAMQQEQPAEGPINRGGRSTETADNFRLLARGQLDQLANPRRALRCSAITPLSRAAYSGLT